MSPNSMDYTQDTGPMVLRSCTHQSQVSATTQDRTYETKTSSEVVGNQAREGSIQYNGDVGRHVNTSTGAGVHSFNITIQNQGPHSCSQHASRSSYEYHLEDTPMPDSGPLSSPIQPLQPLNRTTDQNITVTPSSRDASALLTDIKLAIENITALHHSISQKLATCKHLAAYKSLKENFETQRFMFHVIIEYGDLMAAVKVTLTMSSKMFQKGGPSRGYTDVKQVNNRLHQILKCLIDVDKLIEGMKSSEGQHILTVRLKQRTSRPQPNKMMKRNRIEKKTTKSRFERTSKTTATASAPNPGYLIKMVCGWMSILQKLVMKLDPPDPDEAFNDGHSSAKLPVELEVTRVAAVMLYRSLGAACRNPNHETHGIQLSLSTRQDMKAGGTDATVEFKLAFEGPGDSETWFSVTSTLKRDATESEDMDIDSAIGEGPPTSPAWNQHERPRLRSQSSFSMLEHHHPAAKPTAHFCLRNYRQEFDELAAELIYSNICDHKLFYPAEEDLKHISGEKGKPVTLHKLLKGRTWKTSIFKGQRVRLARLIAESVLKFTAADWLSCRLDGNSVLVCNAQDSLEPHLKIQLRKPPRAGQGAQGQQSIQAMGQTLQQLGIILRNIALGPYKRRNGEDEDAKIRDEMSPGYADVVKECFCLGETQVVDRISYEALQGSVYEKVVGSLQRLEKHMQGFGTASV